MKRVLDKAVHILKSFRDQITDAASADSINDKAYETAGARGGAKRVTRNSESRRMEDLAIQRGKGWDGESRASSSKLSDDIEHVERPSRGARGRGNARPSRGSGGAKGNSSPFFASHAGSSKRIDHEDELAKQQAEGKTKRKGGQAHQLLGPTPQETFYEENRNGRLPPEAVGGLRKLGQSSNTDYFEDSFNNDRPEPSTSTTPSGRSTTKAGPMDHTPMMGSSSATKPRPGPTKSGGFGKHHPKGTAGSLAGSDDDAIPIAVDQVETKPGRSRGGAQKPRDYGNKPSAPPLGKTKGERSKPGETPQTSTGNTGKASTKKTTAPKKATGRSNMPSHFTSMVVRSFLQVNPVTEMFATTLNWDFPSSRCTLHIDKKQFALNPKSAESDSQACPDTDCPFICFWFDTERESSLADSLRHHFGVQSFHRSFGITLLLESGGENGQLVQSIMNKVKSVPDLKFDHLNSSGVRSNLEGLEQQMITDRKSTRGVNRPQIAAAADGRGERERGEKKARKSVAESDAQEYSGKPPKKPTKKGKEKEGEADEDQPKLSFDKKVPKRGRKGNSEPIDLAGSPEAARPRQKSLRQARNSTSKTPNYSLDLADEDDEFQPAPVAPSTPMPPRPENWHGVLFPYPLQGRADINITEGDRWRVEAQDFLNDTLIEFGLKHVLANISELIGDTHVNVEKDVHLFNSFFYEKLSSGSKPAEGTTDTPWAAYQSVRKWTKSKKVFEKKYLIIPINENAHWYLAVIYNPAGILREYVEPIEPIEDTPAPEIPAVDEPTAAAPIDVDQEASAPEIARNDDAVKQKSASPKSTTQADEPESSLRSQPPSTLETDFEIQPSPQPGPSTRSRRGGRASTPRRSLSPDVIARSDQITERHTRESSPDPLLENIPRSRSYPVASTVKKISRDKLKNKWWPKPGESLPSEDPLRPPSPMPDSPEPTPIMNFTTASFTSQNLPDVKHPAPEDGEPTNKTDAPPSETKQSAASKPTAKKKEPLNIWDGDDTWIMTFDSLGGAHKPVERILKLWLEYEAVDKVAERPTRFTPSKYKEARVPQQPNFSDCGLYLIHFVEQLLQRPEEIIRHIELYIPPNQGKVRQEWFKSVNNVWNDEDTQHLRKTWTGIIDSLTAKYSEMKKALLPAAPAEAGKGDEGEGDVGPEIAQVDKSQSSVTQLSQLPLAPAGANAMEDMLRQLGKAIAEEAENGMEGIEEGSGAVIVHGTEDVEMIDQDQAGGLELEPKMDKGKGKERRSASPGLFGLPTLADTHNAIISSLGGYGSTASPPLILGDDEGAGGINEPPSAGVILDRPFERSILHLTTSRVNGVPLSTHFLPRIEGQTRDVDHPPRPPAPSSPIIADLGVDPRLRATNSAQVPPDAETAEQTVSHTEQRSPRADEPRALPSRSRHLSPEPGSPSTTPALSHLPEEDIPIDEGYFVEKVLGAARTTPEVSPPKDTPAYLPGLFPASAVLLQQHRLEKGQPQWAHTGSVRAPTVGKELDDDKENDEEDEEVEMVEDTEHIVHPMRMSPPPESAVTAAESVTTGRSDHSDSMDTNHPLDGYPLSPGKPATLSTPPPPRPNTSSSSRSDKSRMGSPEVFINATRRYIAHLPLGAGPQDYLRSPQDLGGTVGQSNREDEPPQSQHTRFSEEDEEDEEDEEVADSPPKAPKSKGKAKSKSTVDATEIPPTHRPVFPDHPNAPVLQLSRAESPIPHGSAAGPSNGGDNLSQSQPIRIPLGPSGEEDEEVEVLAASSPPKTLKSKGKAKSTSAVDATKTTPTHRPVLPISPNAPVLRSSKIKPPVPHESSFSLPPDDKDESSPLSSPSIPVKRTRTSPSPTRTVSNGNAGQSEAETDVLSVLYTSGDDIPIRNSPRPRPLVVHTYKGVKANRRSAPSRGGESSTSRTVKSDVEDGADDISPFSPKSTTNRKRPSPSKSTPAKTAKAKRPSSGHDEDSVFVEITTARARSASSEYVKLAGSSRSQPILDTEHTPGRGATKKRKATVGIKKAGVEVLSGNEGEDRPKPGKKVKGAPRASSGEGSGKQRANGNTGGVKGSTSAPARPGSRQNPARINLNHGPRGEGPGKGGDTRASPLEIDSD